MLTSTLPHRMPSAAPRGSNAPFQGLPASIAFIRRHLRPIAIGALLGTTLGAGYLATATSQYTAIATLSIDTSRANPAGDQTMVTDWQSQSAYVDSQVALLQSPATLRGVVTLLDLALRLGLLRRRRVLHRQDRFRVQAGRCRGVRDLRWRRLTS